ncbi:MAG TPA: VIT family protein [Candidatus Saccharimonadales bacterium]|nr:VIT family protein [Candidatus Saccharimonadales bacterium]
MIRLIRINRDSNRKSNRLRAAVLGSNDGILSVSGLVIGVASANSSKLIVLTAGVAGIVAGALSMAAGEFISVSAERDNEKALINREKLELERNPQHELNELTHLYENKGLDRSTASRVAHELTKTDALAAHTDIELHINPNNLTNPWYAVSASAASYTSGALIPLIAIMLPLGSLTIPVTFIAVIIALTITGYASAIISGSSAKKAILRVVICGAAAMTITFIIGGLFRVAGI